MMWQDDNRMASHPGAVVGPGDLVNPQHGRRAAAAAERWLLLWLRWAGQRVLLRPRRRPLPPLPLLPPDLHRGQASSLPQTLLTLGAPARDRLSSKSCLSHITGIWKGRRMVLTRTWPSFEPVAMPSPSGENSSSRTSFLCPSRLHTSVGCGHAASLAASSAEPATASAGAAATSTG